MNNSKIASKRLSRLNKVFGVLLDKIERDVVSGEVSNKDTDALCSLHNAIHNEAHIKNLNKTCLTRK